MSNTAQLVYTYGTETYCDFIYGTAGVHLWHRDLRLQNEISKENTLKLSEADRQHMSLKRTVVFSN
jgi:hypothetical protein